jgi:Na+/melibiose symporter-like transporter
VIGVGFWVQGFRLFPWLGVNFFLKDGMGVAASSLQILQASANLPMVAKPLLGLLSDAVPIRGGRRLPYVAIGGTPLSPLFTHCLVLQICGHQPTLRSSP